MVDLAARTQGTVPRIAVVVDVRGRSFFEHLHEALEHIESGGLRHRIVFLESADDVLVRRFENVRRPHPLQGDGRITDGIALSANFCASCAARPTWCSTPPAATCTSCAPRWRARSPAPPSRAAGHGHVLRVQVRAAGGRRPRGGLPLPAQPALDPELRPRTGLDAEVSEYVLAQPGAKDLLESYGEVLRIIAGGYRREGKRYLTLAVGCTGGKHRSVAMSEQIAARLNDDGVDTTVVHRDLGRE